MKPFLLSLRGALALAALVVFAVLGLAPANAADAASTSVVIPWGDWARDLLVAVGSVFVAVATWAIAKLPAAVRVWVTNDAISRAVNYALGKVEGAVAGKELDIHVANSVVAAAARYAVQAEPRVAKWLGDNLQPMIIAKLAALGVTPSEAVTPK